MNDSLRNLYPTGSTATCGGINDDLAPENESDSDEYVTEQIGRCNLPGRSRSNRIVKKPARLYDYF